MTRGKNGTAALFLAGLLIFSTAVSARGEEKAEALAAANAWLGLVDQGKYAEAYQASATMLRNAASEKDFVAQVKGARTAVGKLKSRKVSSAKLLTALPGAPAGRYYVIEFSSSFDHRPASGERVTPMLEDGTWRVSGYYITK